MQTPSCVTLDGRFSCPSASGLLRRVAPRNDKTGVGRGPRVGPLLSRHARFCHREAPAGAPWRSRGARELLRAPRDCFVASLLAMTKGGRSGVPDRCCRGVRGWLSSRGAGRGAVAISWRTRTATATSVSGLLRRVAPRNDEKGVGGGRRAGSLSSRHARFFVIARRRQGRRGDLAAHELQLVVQIAPFGIERFDQCDLLRT
jgi:hypothetical protein